MLKQLLWISRVRLLPLFIRDTTFLLAFHLVPIGGAVAGDVKTEYAASSALTITLASLATSATLVAGQESTAVDNTTNKYLDYLIAGKITTGTTPTDAKEIRVYVYGQAEDVPTYPDVFDGLDSAETVTSTQIRDAALRLAAVIATNTTSDRIYWFGPLSVAALFGGQMPKRFGVFVTHSTVAALNATAGNHAIWITPKYETVAP